VVNDGVIEHPFLRHTEALRHSIIILRIERKLNAFMGIDAVASSVHPP